eukprot:6212136-Pleurochrysis_carterae.AAC.2
MSHHAGQCPERGSWQCVEYVRRAGRGRTIAGRGRHRAHAPVVPAEPVREAEVPHPARVRGTAITRAG